MRISDWSSDVCSSDLVAAREENSALASSRDVYRETAPGSRCGPDPSYRQTPASGPPSGRHDADQSQPGRRFRLAGRDAHKNAQPSRCSAQAEVHSLRLENGYRSFTATLLRRLIIPTEAMQRSEEHTYELNPIMRT